MSQRFLQVHVEQPPCCDVEGWSQTRWTQQSFNWLRVYPESFNLSVSPLCPEQFMCFLYWRNPFLQMQCSAYLKSDSICGFRVYQINMCYIAIEFSVWYYRLGWLTVVWKTLCLIEFVGPNTACSFTADKKNVTNSWLVAETQSVWHAVRIK